MGTLTPMPNYTDHALRVLSNRVKIDSTHPLWGIAEQAAERALAKLKSGTGTRVRDEYDEILREKTARKAVKCTLLAPVERFSSDWSIASVCSLDDVTFAVLLPGPAKAYQDAKYVTFDAICPRQVKWFGGSSLCIAVGDVIVTL